jgi:hypothetical protein
MPIAAKFSSLKPIIIASRDNTSVASGNVNGVFPDSSNKFQLNQTYFRIGSVVLPPKFPTTSAEYYAELLKAVGSMSDLQCNPAIDYTSYNQDYVGLHAGVLVGPSTAIVQTVDFTASGTTSGTFYYGINLETYCSAAKSEIFAGHNTNTDDIFYVLLLLQINLLSMICNEKYFPLFACTSAPIRVEIQLVPNLGCCMASDQIVGSTFTLNNVEYVMNTIELGDSAMQTIQSYNSLWVVLEIIHGMQHNPIHQHQHQQHFQCPSQLNFHH